VPNHLWIRRLASTTITAAVLTGSVVHTAADAPRRTGERAVRASTVSQSAGAAYLRLPLRFERAHQAGVTEAFVARGSGYSVSVSAAGASLSLREQSGGGHRTVMMSLAGGNREARATLRRALPGFSNYLIGSDRQQWVTGVRGYGEIEYRGVYRGVDVVYYGNQRKLEFDFIVAPGARVDAIALAFDGANSVSVNPAGEVVIGTDGGNLVQHRPTIYQDDRGVRRAIRGGYVVRRDGKIGFRVGKYDRRLPLIIDPVLSYATYLGGANTERGYGVAVDPAGHVIVAGVTVSPDFPVVNAAQPHKRGHVDAFVVKLTPAGDAMAYSTYFGGGGYDEARDVAVDDGGNAYVAGYTDSWDFPMETTLGTPEWRKQMFVVKLDATGALAYSTLIGGSGSDDVKGIAVDAGGRAHIAGMTSSADFPLVDPWQPSLGGYPAFRTHDGGGAWTALKTGLQVSGVSAFGFDPAEPAAVYAGSNREGLFKSVDDGTTWTRVNLPAQRFYAIATQEGATPAVVAGGDFGLYRSHDRGATWTVVSPYGGAGVKTIAISRQSPAVMYVGLAWSAGLLKSVDGGDTWIDTGVAEPVQLLAASGSTVYAITQATNGSGTVLRSSNDGPWEPAGGTGRDVPVGMLTALAVDPVDPQVAYVGTDHGLFKTTSGGAAWVPVFDFQLYVGIIAIAPSDPSTLFVGTSSGHLFIRNDGQTWSMSGLRDESQLAVVAFDPIDSAHVFAGYQLGLDGFVATLSADGSRLEYATYIGGTGVESAQSIAVDGSGNRYVTGDTFSTDFPTLHPIQHTFGGTWDSFVVKLSPSGNPVYSTYLGGGHTDYSARIAADGSGRAYVTGLTLSTNFPIVNASQPAHGGGFSDVFVTALNESGSAFLYSTFLGGSAMENDPGQALGPSIAVTLAGEASVTGTTQSINFPVTTDAWHRTHAGGVSDVFVSRYDAAGTLQYSTFLGGPGADYARRIALDSTGAIVIAGYTDSTNWATPTAVQPSYAGSDDAFVAKLSPGATPLDTTAPTTTVALSGTPGVDGWYRSPVTISLSAADNDQGRGLAYIEYRLTGGVFQRYTTPFTVTQSGTSQITVRAVDWAGNVESPTPSTTVRIDTTPPTVSFQVTGAFGLSGWLKSPATVTVFAVDIVGTGVESVEYRIGDAAFQSYTGSFAISAEGVTQVTARATDRNGNVSTATRTVSIDTSAPRTSVAVSSTPGLTGWYTSPVTVALSGLDAAPGSGVAAVEYRINDGVFVPYVSPFVVSGQGATRVTARATDRAGNVESSLPSAVVMIDSSAPFVAIASPEARDYLHSESAAVSFSAADGMSGLDSVSAALDGGAVEHSQTIALLAHSLGTHTLEVIATDVAGNLTRQAVSFRIIATIDSLIASVNIYAEQGAIDAANLRSLLAKLKDAKAALDRGNTSGASAKLGDVITQCRTQSGRGISADAAAALTAEADYVIGTF
jgi:hypothetical protein